jgi:hypothetical protein
MQTGNRSSHVLSEAEEARTIVEPAITLSRLGTAAFKESNSDPWRECRLIMEVHNMGLKARLIRK